MEVLIQISRCLATPLLTPSSGEHYILPIALISAILTTAVSSYPRELGLAWSNLMPMRSTSIARTRAMETAPVDYAPPILTQAPLCLLWVGASSICLYRPLRFPIRPRTVEKLIVVHEPGNSNKFQHRYYQSYHTIMK